MFGSLSAIAEQADDIHKYFPGHCAKGKSADSYSDWEYIANLAVKIADTYATERRPESTFIGKDVKVETLYQFGGKYQRTYLIKLLNNSDAQEVNFAMLKPNFNFCSDPAHLDQKDMGLFSVVIAKYNGTPY